MNGHTLGIHRLKSENRLVQGLVRQNKVHYWKVLSNSSVVNGEEILVFYPQTAHDSRFDSKSNRVMTPVISQLM